MEVQQIFQLQTYQFFKAGVETARLKAPYILQGYIIKVSFASIRKTIELVRMNKGPKTSSG